MKIKITVIALFCCAVSSIQAQNNQNNFHPLFSLVGTWSMETKKGLLYESWQKINDSTLKGSSFKINGEDTIYLEQVQLAKRLDKIIYVPVVPDENKQQPVIFTLVHLENDTYTFENPEHDFPQRIIYVLPVNNSLHAWIEGNTSSGFKKTDYQYKRAE